MLMLVMLVMLVLALGWRELALREKLVFENGSRTDPFTVRVRASGRYARIAALDIASLLPDSYSHR